MQLKAQDKGLFDLPINILVRQQKSHLLLVLWYTGFHVVTKSPKYQNKTPLLVSLWWQKLMPALY